MGIGGELEGNYVLLRKCLHFEESLYGLLNALYIFEILLIKV